MIPPTRLSDGSSHLPSAAPTFSIVIPVYNEEQSLHELLASIEQAMTSFNDSHEVVLVDDGSTDGTFDKLTFLAEAHEGVRVLSFRRRLGKSAALLYGFHYATGRRSAMSPVGRRQGCSATQLEGSGYASR